MTTTEPIYEALKRLEHADLPQVDREMLRPAFAALHGGVALALPERVIHRVRELDRQFGAAAA
ncbi:hypothetical protein QCE62_07115 [Caballeronia sp. LZ033]|uniref:hypothetical protein n=1 Tax=Caballeronia sp. LZ033 TaxID=3038566 RepID=UPI0028550CB9|nr:hypothetical protein [Caballeronia sp. LZ033]MDR5813362.1 hypothetical protein [Caballeronia sp. LZ033]